MAFVAMDMILAEAATLVAGIWIGLILGVSFFAAPIKFRARGVAFDQLLLVGKVTFQGFTWVELGMLVLLIVASATRFDTSVGVALAALTLLLAVQKLGVLPALDRNLDKAVAGTPVGGRGLHFVYAGLDVAKLVVLIALAT